MQQQIFVANLRKSRRGITKTFANTLSENISYVQFAKSYEHEIIVYQIVFRSLVRQSTEWIFVMFKELFRCRWDTQNISTWFIVIENQYRSPKFGEVLSWTILWLSSWKCSIKNFFAFVFFMQLRLTSFDNLRPKIDRCLNTSSKFSCTSSKLTRERVEDEDDVQKCWNRFCRTYN